MQTCVHPLRPGRGRGCRAVVPTVGLALTCSGVLVACRSYEREPLQLAAHAAAVDARLIDIAPVSAFAQRLRSGGAAAPEHFDLGDGLSLAEGEVLGLLYNPDVRLARLQAGVALANFESAGLWEDPVFGFDAQEILSSAAPLTYGLTLSLTIPISGRLDVEKARAGAAHEAELRRVADAEWRLRADIRRAWSAWSAAIERAELVGDMLEETERIASLTDRLEAAGELSRVESRLFRVEHAERRAALDGAQIAAARARLALLGLLGLSPSASVELVPALAAPALASPEDAVNRLIAANTRLAVRRAEYQVAEETLRLEVRKQYPDLTIGSGYGSEDGDDRLLLGASLPIPLLNANRASIDEAIARRTLARAAAEAVLEQLARELAEEQAALRAARAQLARFETEIVPMLDEQRTEVERIAELGEVDALLLLETLTRHFDAKSRLLDLRLEEAEALVGIHELLGPEPGAAQPPPERGGESAPGERDTDKEGGT